MLLTSAHQVAGLSNVSCFVMTADSSTATDSCDEATLVAERWQRRYCCAVYGQGCVYMSPCPCVTSNSVMLFI